MTFEYNKSIYGLKKNIILIGMPGSGKSTLGQMLAKNLEFEFVDTDEIIEEEYGQTISDIFKEYGEEIFRDVESDTLHKIFNKAKMVVSTGGGVILREKNMNFLKQYGIIVFIKRDPCDIIRTIDYKSRPLLKEGKDAFFKLYQERLHLYEEYADIIVGVRASIKESLDLLSSKVLELAK